MTEPPKAGMQVWIGRTFKIIPDRGPECGTWKCGNPNTNPQEFNRTAADLGWQILCLISHGAGAILIKDVEP